MRYILTSYITGLFMSDSIAILLRKRQALAKELAALEPLMLRGSLIERYKRCGSPGCKCQEGKGHGPKYYLSVSQAGGRPQMDYVPEEFRQQTLDYLHNFQKVRQLLEAICNLNRQLLKRRATF